MFQIPIGTLTVLLLLQILRIAEDVGFHAIPKLADQRADEVAQILAGRLNVSHCR
ncbi:hypothetical protein D3C78_1592770 [compost metagenome]